MIEFSRRQFRQRFSAALRRGDIAKAARELEANCDTLLAQGHADLFASSVQSIPQRVQAFHPKMMLALAWRLIAQWHFDQVDDLLAATRLRLAEMERSGADRDELDALRHALLHREMMLALGRDDMVSAEKLCASLIAERYRSDAYVKGSLYTSLLQARREQFKLAEVDRLDTQATDYLCAEGNANALFIHSAVAGLSLFALGRSDEAIARLRDTFESAVAIGRGAGPVAAISALPLAEILYERADYAEARRLIDAYLPQAADMGIIDQLVSGYLTAARLAFRAGDRDAALSVLEKAKVLAAQRGFQRLSAWATAERISILAHCGRLSRRDMANDELQLLQAADRYLPTRQVTTVKEALAFAWSRVAEAHCRLDDGLRIALAWSKRAASAGALKSRIRWNLSAIRFLLLAGEARRARRLLDETLSIAAPGLFISSFRDEPAIVAYLRELYQDRPDAPDPAVGEFVDAILDNADAAGHVATPPPDEGPAALDKLSPREIDVLRLAAAAWRNQDIAARLGLTEGTVKWYLQQIYDKLGVRKRSLAVDKARRFGLVSTGPMQ